MKADGVSGPFLYLNFNYDPIGLPFSRYTTVAFHFASSVFRLAGPWTDGTDGVMADDCGCDGVEIDETLPRRALCPTQTCLFPESLLWEQSYFACKI